jgi:hypothetical protein
MNRAALAAVLLAGCSGGPGPVEVFNDPARPYADRLDALLALRKLEGEEARRAYDACAARLEDEAARGTGISVMSDLEARGCAEALLWLAERGAGAEFLPELYLGRKALPERVRAASARALGRHPKSSSARDTLWAVLKDPKEAPPVRSAALEGLRAFHPDDLPARVAALPAAEDPWLAGLKSRLK